MAGWTADYDRVAACLAACDDTTLRARLTAAPGLCAGIGGASSLLDVEGVPVHAKRIPLTDWELAQPHSTLNLFDLPMYCHYGGGPGFNAWRELAANLTVTAGMLTGDTRSFAPLYHWRVLPGPPPRQARPPLGDCAPVRLRLESQAAASWSLVLFSQYLPDPLPAALAETPLAVERQLDQTVAFLRDRELLHMDIGLENLRTDGQRIVLVDFARATSPRFELSAEEADFVRRHATHDADHVAMTLVNWLATSVCEDADGDPPVARDALVEACVAGDIPAEVPPAVAEVLARHAPTAARLNAFYGRLHAGDLDHPYPTRPTGHIPDTAG